MLSVDQLSVAHEIVAHVVGNGRIEKLKDGSFNPESIYNEVEFEANERGRKDSAELAGWAKAQYE